MYIPKLHFFLLQLGKTINLFQTALVHVIVGILIFPNSYTLPILYYYFAQELQMQMIRRVIVAEEAILEHPPHHHPSI